jgi:hypothetical protein
MSYKLVDQIIRKSRAASGSTKAVLIAMATYAEDDGTNIFPAMNNLADDAGVGERTAYRAVDELLELGLINETGNKHHWGRGHYTVEYVINLNPPTVCEIDSLSNGQRQSAKLTKPHCQDGTQLSHKGFTQSEETVKAMNEGTSEREAEASLPTVGSSASPSKGKTKPIPEEWCQLIVDLVPHATGNPVVLEREKKALRSIMLRVAEPNAVRRFWAWNALHKSGKWRFTSLNTALKSMDSESEKSGWSMFLSCQQNPCKLCLKGKGEQYHSSGCTGSPCICYLSLSPDAQKYWLTLEGFGLVGNVGRKWYLGKSADEAIAGFPDLNSLIVELYGVQPPELIRKLTTLVGEYAAVVPDPSVYEDTGERYMSGTAFEVEEDLR